jgi:stage III sporulation protein AG
MDKEKKSLKEVFSLKEIGLTRLIMIFIAGILIILLSFPGMLKEKKSTEDIVQNNNTALTQNDTNTTSYDTNNYIIEMENKLEGILKKVSGIGEVEVMLTVKTSKELVPLKDTPSTQESLNEDDGEGGSRTNSSVQRDETTVMVQNENGETVPYIIQEREPKIEGVLVIAEGGEDVRIKMDIMQTAQVLFNVPAHKVIVMKMSNGN